MTFLTLNPRFVLGSLDLTASPFLVNQDGLDFGTGDLVTSVLSSFLQDGDLEVSQRRGNMSLSVPVLIEGNDLLALAQALQSLALEAEKDVNTFSVDPGDGLGPVTVFDTFKADINYTYNANAEQQGFRQYSVTFRALPFGRSNFSVVAAAAPTAGSPTSVTVNDGTSVTGWTTSVGSVTTSGGAVRATGSASSVDLTLTQSIDVSTRRWVTANWVAYSATSFKLTARSAGGNAVDLAPYRVDYGQPSGYVRSVWLLPSSVTSPVTSLSFRAQVSEGTPSLAIDQVTTATGAPTLGSTRQQVQQIPVAGSARTQGSVQVSSATTSLNDVMVYTSPADILPPPLRGFATTTPVASTTTVSGGYFGMNSPAVWDVPNALLDPGLYMLFVLASSPGSEARTLQCVVSASLSGTAIGRTITRTTPVSSSTYKFLPLGTLNLPTIGSRQQTSVVQRFTLTDTSGGGTFSRIDDLYLCNLTSGRLSMVSAGTSRRLWLDSASLTTLTPRIMLGTAADGTDAYYAGDSIVAFGQHEFLPPSTAITYISTNATDVSASMTHQPRWLGHAALAGP